MLNKLLGVEQTEGSEATKPQGSVLPWPSPSWCASASPPCKVRGCIWATYSVQQVCMVNCEGLARYQGVRTPVFGSATLKAFCGWWGFSNSVKWWSLCQVLSFVTRNQGSLTSPRTSLPMLSITCRWSRWQGSCRRRHWWEFQLRAVSRVCIDYHCQWRDWWPVILVWIVPGIVETWAVSGPCTAMHINNSDPVVSSCAGAPGPPYRCRSAESHGWQFINPELFTVHHLSQAVNLTFIYPKLTSFKRE